MNSIQNEIRKKWKKRKSSSHKGDYGRIFILAGSQNYSGAAYLAGAACLRAGAGLVTLAVPDKIHAIVARRQPELMIQPMVSTREGSLAKASERNILKALNGQDVLALGPGLSQNSQTRIVIQNVLRKNSLPIVIDADGLNALRGKLEILKKCAYRSIITPHPGEFVRLFGGRLDDTSAIREKRASEAAAKFKCIVVLKGHRTVAAHPDGRTYINKTGNPGMATAGTGDVLTGILAALIGQRFSLWDSARFAVYLHGLSGDLAAEKKGQISLIAGDLIEFFPQALQKTLS